MTQSKITARMNRAIQAFRTAMDGPSCRTITNTKIRVTTQPEPGYHFTKSRSAYYWIGAESHDGGDTYEVLLVPSGGGEASSSVNYDRYEYTHGGALYRAAVKLAHEIRMAAAGQL